MRSFTLKNRGALMSRIDIAWTVRYWQVDGALLASALRFLGDVSCERIIVKMIVDFFLSASSARCSSFTQQEKWGYFPERPRKKK